MIKNSIGNDIVALTNTDIQRACNQRFYSKFLTSQELALFNNLDPSLSFVEFVWLCWSIKESVYKYQKRLQPQLLSGGWKIMVQSITQPFVQPDFELKDGMIQNSNIPVEFSWLSEAVINGNKYYSWSLVTKAFIHTVTANVNDAPCVCWGIQPFNNNRYKTQSAAVRKFMLRQFCSMYGHNKYVILKTAEGVPYVSQKPQIPVSFSHDSDFIAYAFLLKNIVGEEENIFKNDAGNDMNPLFSFSRCGIE